MTTNQPFIIDVGLHKGEDTSYYLSLGYNVVGVEADPKLCELARTKFAEYGLKFKALNYAVAEKDNEIVSFNLSKESLWNSLDQTIANRHSKLKETIQVETMTLASIIESMLTRPYYVKIDIEGYDPVAIRSLKALPWPLMPMYVSCESECAGSRKRVTEKQSLDALNALKEVGYTKFKLVDQNDLSVVDPITLDRHYLNEDFEFEQGASGPFGPNLAGDWTDYESAKKMLTNVRREHYAASNRKAYSFWYDWHASR